jgi:hypothetical protein
MEIVPTTIAISVNHEFKVVFVHIPKNAGSSIREVYFPKYSYRVDMCKSNSRKYIFRTPLKTDEELVKYVDMGYKTFTVWRRDVVDRFQTSYLEDMKRANRDCSWVKNMGWYRERDMKQRFLTYLSEAEEYGGFSHCIKQTDAVRDCKGTIRTFDYNFTMETVHNIPNVLFDGRNLPRKESNRKWKPTIASFIDRHVVRRIRKLYLDDIQYITNLGKEERIWKDS